MNWDDKIPTPRESPSSNESSPKAEATATKSEAVLRKNEADTKAHPAEEKKKKKDEDDEGGAGMPVPQVKVTEDGRIIIDETTLIIEQPGSDRVLDSATIVENSYSSTNYNRLRVFDFLFSEYLLYFCQK